jgi:hypothetical protein
LGNRLAVCAPSGPIAVCQSGAQSKDRATCDFKLIEEAYQTMRSILLLMLGIPIPIVILIALFVH